MFNEVIKEVEIIFVSENDVSLSETLVYNSKDMLYTNSNQKKQELKIDESPRLSSLIKNLNHSTYSMLKAATNTDLFQKEMTEAELFSFCKTNMIQVDDDEYYTKAGEERVEKLVFRDKNQNSVAITDLAKYEIKFIHNRDFRVKAKGNIFKEKEDIFISWKPIYKGEYSLFINNQSISSCRNLKVVAAEANFEKIIHRMVDFKSYNYFDTIDMEFEFRDLYDNILNEFEFELYYPDDHITIEWSKKDDKVIKSRYRIKSDGIFTIGVRIEPKSIKDTVFKTEIGILNICFVGKLLKEIQLKVNGISFDQRRKEFLKQVKNTMNKINTISISRENFLDDLIAEDWDKFKIIGSVKFNQEAGIDAGGLRRDFWDLVGETMKNNKYDIFEEINGKYYFSTKVVWTSKTESVLRLFGSLLASSIINVELIGVHFCTSLIKNLYEEELKFEDLQDILDDQTFNNYKMLLNVDYII